MINRSPTAALGRETALAAALLVLLLASTLAAALPSAPPRAQLVQERSERAVPYEFVTGSMHREKHIVKPERSVRVTGDLVRRTWQLADDDSLERAVQRFHDELAVRGSIVFSCDGRRCGRSTYWANNVFQVAVLNAPDSDQHYLAARIEDGDVVTLVAVYVVRRANGRLYAHADTLRTDAATSPVIEVDLSATLAREGFVQVPIPELRERDWLLETSVLDAVRRARRVVPDDELWVICHMYGRATDELLADSRRCAERIASQIGEGVRAFGAGPLLPRTAGDAPLRIELVAPGLLRRPVGPPR